MSFPDPATTGLSDPRGVWAALAALQAKEAKRQSLAYHDGLTGLPNRSLFYDRLGLAIRHSSRERSRIRTSVRAEDTVARLGGGRVRRPAAAGHRGGGRGAA